MSWPAVRLRHVVRINPPCPRFDTLSSDAELTFLPMEAVWPDDRLDISRTRTKAAVATGYTRFQDGDVLVPKITPTFEASRSVLINNLLNGVGAGTTELHVLRPSEEIDPRFLLYITHSHPFLKLGEAEMYGVAGQKRVPDDFIRDFTVGLPPLEEQRRIADFLDDETARLVQLQASMEKQIELLTERRRTVLNFIWHSTTDYTRIRVGFVVDLVTSGPRGWGDYVADSGRLFFRSGNLRRDSLIPNLENLAFVQPPATGAVEARRSQIHVGDVLIGITGANTGWVALADESIAGGNVSQHVCLVRPMRDRVDSRWLAYAISSPGVQDELMASQYGGTKTQLSLPDIRNIPLPIYPLEEQRVVVREIDKQLGVIERQRELRAAQLALLAERRQALITAAVTGQIDVTTARGIDA